MIVVVTNSQDATADYLLSQPGLGHCVRIDTDRLASADNRVSIRVGPSGLEALAWLDERAVRPNDVDVVWFRRPRPFEGDPRDNGGTVAYVDNERRAAWRSFLSFVPRDRWMNYPAANTGASNKIEQLERARGVGLLTPESLITQSPSEAQSFFLAHPGGVVIKPVDHGFIEASHPHKDQLVYCNSVNMDWLSRHIEDLPACPTYFQELVPKRADIRVTCVDEQFMSVRLTASDGRVDIRRDNMHGVEYEPYELDDRVQDGLRQLLASYGLRFAAIDLVERQFDRELVFLEINPNGQWAWLDLEADAGIAPLFTKAWERRRDPR